MSRFAIQASRSGRARLTALVLLAALAFAALTVVGNGSAGAASSNYDSQLKALYKGRILPPPKSGPKAVPDKNVWEISCGAAFEACANIDKAFKSATNALGWKTTVVD